MDPVAAWELMLEGNCQALQDLAVWMLRGGFIPTTVDASELDCEVFREDGYYDLAASVRCAIANDDLSGLRYAFGMGVSPVLSIDAVHATSLIAVRRLA